MRIIVCYALVAILGQIESPPVINNPEKPSKGTVVLKVEKTLTIAPYDYPDFGMRSFSFTRNDDGSVILFNANKTQAHRFDARGRNLGPLGRSEQGPGEFDSSVRPFFHQGKILISSGKKLIFSMPSDYRVTNLPEIFK